MIKLFYFIFFITLWSFGHVGCNKGIFKDTAEQNNILVSDTLFHYILKQGLNGSELSQVQPKPDFEFSSGETKSVSFYKYGFKYKHLKYVFLSKHYTIAKRSIYIDKNKAKIFRYNTKFNVDSLNLNIDYTESDCYLFKKELSYLLIVSKPMNWTGTMTKFSFFQLINFKKRTVIEFIREDE